MSKQYYFVAFFVKIDFLILLAAQSHFVQQQESVTEVMSHKNNQDIKTLGIFFHHSLTVVNCEAFHCRPWCCSFWSEDPDC